MKINVTIHTAQKLVATLLQRCNLAAILLECLERFGVIENNMDCEITYVYTVEGCRTDTPAATAATTANLRVQFADLYNRCNANGLETVLRS